MTRIADIRASLDSPEAKDVFDADLERAVVNEARKQQQTQRRASLPGDLRGFAEEGCTNVTSGIHAFRESVHPLHFNSEGRKYVDSVRVDTGAESAYTTGTAGSFYRSVVEGLAADPSNREEDERWLVVASSMNFAEAVLRTRRHAKVRQILTFPQNVEVVRKVSDEFRERLSLSHGAAGDAHAGAHADAAISGFRFAVADLKHLRDYPLVLHALTDFVVSQLSTTVGGLRRGGVVYLVLGAPRRSGDALWTVLTSFLTTVFSGDVLVDVDTHVLTRDTPTLRIAASGFVPISPPLARAFTRLRDTLSIGDPTPSSLYSPEFVESEDWRDIHGGAEDRRASIDRSIMRVAYADATKVADAVARQIAAGEPGRPAEPARKEKKKAAEELRNELLQLNWRGAHVDTTAACGGDPGSRGISRRLKYIEEARDLEPRCHWGQMKLLASELEFLTDAWIETGKPRRMVVVYAGSADGMHIPVIANMFPEAIIHAYDGRRFHPSVYQHPRIRVRDGHEGYVTDEAMPAIRRAALVDLRGFEEAGEGALLFVSDIRGGKPTNENVHADMMSQARWCGVLGASHMLLKFRLPYPSPKGGGSLPGVTPARPHEFVNVADNTVTSVSPEASPYKYLYLRGDVVPQLFAPVHTTETRLVVRAPLGLHDYDALAYEEQLNAFNLGVRRTSHPLNPPLDLWLPGHDRAYESAQLYRIVENYVNVRSSSNSGRPPEEPSSPSSAHHHLDPRVARLIFVIERHLAKHSHRTLAGCVIRTLEDYHNDLQKKTLCNKNPEVCRLMAERLRMWKNATSVQNDRNMDVSVRRMFRHAVRDGVMSREEAEEWRETLRRSSSVVRNQHRNGSKK